MMKIKNKLRLRRRFFMMALGPATLCVSLGAVTACHNANAASKDNSNAAFQYREIYLPEALGDNAVNYGLNSLDNDWGIWGHNIGKMIPEKHSRGIYAKVDGEIIKKQYCFTNPHLFEYIEEYISNKYDEDAEVRFAILPNDNNIVCLCEECVIIGNTKNNASPAVNHLVRKLAERFPGHYFFTSDYKTTRQLPTDTMPPNTGVLVSAIDFPLTPVSTREEEKFISRLKSWGETTPNIFVWDYINNFDDYFTPFPALGSMQRRLKEYRDNKVSAIFLNGSGPDASAMSALHTEVLAALTENPDIDWKELLRNKALETYPVSGNLIADYMIAQEENVEENGVVLPLYEGVPVAVKTYLQPDKFIKFHEDLRALKRNLQGNEYREVDKLLHELALTRLELNRINGTLDDSQEFIEELRQLALSGVPSYNEAGWTIDNYISDYTFLINHYAQSKENKLKGEELTALTPLDPDYSDISLLTDGVLAIPSNYHSGNLIISPEKSTRISVPNNGDFKKLVVWMSYNPAYRVYLPEKVTLKAGDNIKEAYPQYPEDGSGHSKIEFDLSGTEKGAFVLTFFKDPEHKSIALEEIEAY